MQSLKREELLSTQIEKYVPIFLTTLSLFCVYSSFSLHHDHTRFSIFRFNREVDTQSQILLSDSVKSRHSLLEDFERISSQLEEGELKERMKKHLNGIKG